MNIKKFLVGFSASAILMASTAIPAFADSLSINFEPTTYSLGNINGQDGWSMTGPYDVEVDGSFGYGAFGAQSFRISNAVTSGSFGDWAFSKSLANEAGETVAENGGMSGGTRQPYFEASFDFASTVPDAEQPGLQMSLAPDRGDGARMSFLRLKDTPTGLQVDFADYQSGVNEVGCVAGDNFIDTPVASSLDRTVPHNIKLTMQFVDGLNNDIVKVYVDGSLAHTGTSWEGYFNECEGNQTRTVDSLIFQARSGGGTAPATFGFGFLIDNLSTLSGPIPVKVGSVTGGLTLGLGTPSSPRQQISFNAFDYGTNSLSDYGTVEYQNFDYPGGLHYTANITCATVDKVNKDARFMFQIPAGWPGLTGIYVISEVMDRGTPGTKGDTYGHSASWDLLTAKTWCESGSTPSLYPITGGNLVVHK